MKNMSPFQIVILVIFAVIGVLGVFFFATFEGKDSENNIGNVVIWGTLDNSVMVKQIEVMAGVDKATEAKVAYVQKDPRTYRLDLIEAFATGQGPDLFLIRQDDVLLDLNKIFLVPYESFTARLYKDTYAEISELFLDPSGIIAFPYILDPLIMYWNRDILSRENISIPPRFWDEFFTLSPQMTKRDQVSNILLATVSLGEYSNVTHAKEIISALMIQAGNPIAQRGSRGGVASTLTSSFGFTEQPAESALRFYTEFSNPVKSVYSWNRSLPRSRDAFLSGDLAFYFGFASELNELRRVNPNLNFDVAQLPQARNESVRATFGHLQGWAIAKNSRNVGGALRVAALLASDPMLLNLQETLRLPPVSRNLLGQPPADDVQPLFYSSALISQAWLEPDKERTETIFREMIESITSGRQHIGTALSDAHNQLDKLLRQ